MHWWKIFQAKALPLQNPIRETPHHTPSHGIRRSQLQSIKRKLQTAALKKKRLEMTSLGPCRNISVPSHHPLATKRSATVWITRPIECRFWVCWKSKREKRIPPWRNGQVHTIQTRRSSKQHWSRAKRAQIKMRRDQNGPSLRVQNAKFPTILALYRADIFWQLSY